MATCLRSLAPPSVPYRSMFSSAASRLASAASTGSSCGDRLLPRNLVLDAITCCSMGRRRATNRLKIPVFTVAATTELMPWLYRRVSSSIGVVECFASVEPKYESGNVSCRKVRDAATMTTVGMALSSRTLRRALTASATEPWVSSSRCAPLRCMSVTKKSMVSVCRWSAAARRTSSSWVRVRKLSNTLFTSCSASTTACGSKRATTASTAMHNSF
mmetsp:Transcript_8125/g.25522  ORF Transcript_8125/g.25522 Transcript_8125/m.25522 type:complete len:216 (+) Transcript_8125:145-792(+)